MVENNPIGLRGIEFVEFCSKDSKWLDVLFKGFGFSKVAKNDSLDSYLYVQNDIKFILNEAKNSFSREFERLHGPCISSMGWRDSS